MMLRPLRRMTQLGMVLLLLAGLAAAIHWRVAFNPLAIRDAIIERPAAPLIFIGLHILASLLFVPRTLLGITAGLIWGLWWGSALATIGGMAGAVAGFAVARYLNGGVIRLDKIPGLKRLIDRMDGGGWRMVAFLRLVPVMPHTPVNYAFGLTRVSLQSYLIGSFIGLLPSTIFSVDVGSAGNGALTGSGHWVVPTLLGLGMLAVSFLMPRLFRARNLVPARDIARDTE